MRNRSVLRAFVIAFAAVIARTAAAAGQAPSAPPPSALDSCIAAASHHDFAGAERIAAASIQSLQAARSRGPANAELLVRTARFITQCQMPGVDQMRLGELSDETIDLLTAALAIEPTHWLARYLLALQYFRAPAFLERSGLAVNELDRLIAQQRASRAPAIYARPFEYRGTLWMRANRADSARAVWLRGLELFPADSALLELVGNSHAPASIPTPPTRETKRVP